MDSSNSASCSISSMHCQIFPKTLKINITRHFLEISPNFSRLGHPTRGKEEEEENENAFINFPSAHEKEREMGRGEAGSPNLASRPAHRTNDRPTGVTREKKGKHNGGTRLWYQTLTHAHGQGEKSKRFAKLEQVCSAFSGDMWGMSGNLYPLGEEGGGAISSSLFSPPPKPRM